MKSAANKAASGPQVSAHVAAPPHPTPHSLEDLRKSRHLKKPLLMENAAVCKFCWRSEDGKTCKARSNGAAGLLADAHKDAELRFHVVPHAA